MRANSVQMHANSVQTGLCTRGCSWLSRWGGDYTQASDFLHLSPADAVKAGSVRHFGSQ
uniref:Uncharacterized protein n=1 Tax=Arundo donax TaxID=35708 RepID=A0A0A8YUU1_ARUDO